MAPPAAIDVLPESDTSTFTLPDRLTIQGVAKRRAAEGRLVAGVAALADVDRFKGRSVHAHKPKARRWDREYCLIDRLMVVKDLDLGLLTGITITRSIQSRVESETSQLVEGCGTILEDAWDHLSRRRVAVERVLPVRRIQRQSASAWLFRKQDQPRLHVRWQTRPRARNVRF